MSGIIRGNLAAAIVWRWMFFGGWLLAMLIGAAAPLVTVVAWMKIEAWLGIDRLVGAETTRQINGVGLLAASAAALRCLFLFLRLGRRVRHAPKFSGLHAFLPGQNADAEGPGLEQLRSLAANVAATLGTKPFTDIVVSTGVGAATSEVGGKKTLHLGWLALQYLTVEQIQAVTAHEAAHYDHHAQTYHGTLWKLRRTASSLQHEARILYFGMKAREADSSSESFKQSVPLLLIGLGYACGIVRIYGRILENRLQGGNQRFEYYCDAVAAQHFGAAALSEALLMITVLQLAWSDFLRANGDVAPAGMSAQFRSFFRNWQKDPRQLEAFYEACIQSEGTHPGVYDRCLAVGYKLPEAVEFPAEPNRPLLSAGPNHPVVLAVDARMVRCHQKYREKLSIGLAEVEGLRSEGRRGASLIVLHDLVRQFPTDGAVHWRLVAELCEELDGGSPGSVTAASRDCIRHSIQSRRLGIDTSDHAYSWSFRARAGLSLAMERYFFSKHPLGAIALSQMYPSRESLELALESLYYLFPDVESAAATLLLAEVYERHGKHYAAEKLCVTVLRADPACAVAGMILARNLGRRSGLGHPSSSAVEFFTAWLAKFENIPLPQWQQATEKSAVNVLADARAHFGGHWCQTSTIGRIITNWPDDYEFSKHKGPEYFELMLARARSEIAGTSSELQFG